MRGFCLLLLAAAALLPVARAAEAPTRAVVIPIHGEMGEPTLYLLRRGLKLAAATPGTAVVLDVKTPGGELASTFDMIEAMTRFSGATFAYVDDEAMSAGAILSASADEVWFSPKGIMGAAAPVSSTGQDIDATMKAKLVSYMKARIRADTARFGYRAEVVSAMVDAGPELKIGGTVIKPKDELLSVTADEAMKAYGDPPQRLLAAGVAGSVDDLLRQKYGAHPFPIDEVQPTWSEGLAVLLNKVSPVLMGLGLFAIFIAFKTSNFGVFGVSGLALLGIVFLSGYIAGLSGHEPVVLFGVGVILLALELIFFHSAGFLGVVGLGCILLSLLWSMADLWPGEPLRTAWELHAFVRPMLNLGFGLAIAVLLGAAAIRWLPGGWLWDRLVVTATIPGTAQSASGGPSTAGLLDALIGSRGVVVTVLRPQGQIEIDGRRYEAAIPFGTLPEGTAVRVRSRADFTLNVEADTVAGVADPGRGQPFDSAQGTRPRRQPAAMIGQPATAVTTLAPSGYVIVGDERYEAYCESGHAPVGAVLRVVGIDTFRLVVAAT